MVKGSVVRNHVSFFFKILKKAGLLDFGIRIPVLACHHQLLAQRTLFRRQGHELLVPEPRPFGFGK
jgi:hypothetical protein